MARRFRGEWLHKVDTKGRVSIPAPFRRVLELNDEEGADPKSPSVVILYGTARNGYLECYSMAAVEEVDEQIAELPRGSTERKIMEAYFNGKSVQTSIDETGRLVLSKSLRDLIGLKDEAQFVGSGDTFKIWTPVAYGAQEEVDAEALLETLPEDADPMILLERRKS